MAQIDKNTTTNGSNCDSTGRSCDFYKRHCKIQELKININNFFFVFYDFISLKKKEILLLSTD